MAKIQIIPGFEVEPGNCSLRVVTLDFLKSRGFSPTTGYHFTPEMEARYGGKKLKLHHVESFFSPVNGARFRFYFDKNKSDTHFGWNEYMFKQYWDAIDAAKANAKTEARPEPAKVAPVESAVPTQFKALTIKVLSIEDELNKYRATLRSVMDVNDTLTRAVKILEKENSDLKRAIPSIIARIDGISMAESENESTIESLCNDVESIVASLEEKAAKAKKGDSKNDKMLKMLLLMGAINGNKATDVTAVAPVETKKD